MKRRTVLTAAVAGAAGLSGCLSTITGGGGGGSTPSQETLEPTSGPTATDTAAAKTAEDTTTADASTTGDGSDGGTTTGTAGEDATAPDVEFDASVDDIQECGRTCRALFYTVSNRGTDDAASVGVRIRVFTGGGKVYDEVQDIGPLDARSKRDGIKKQIDVGLGGAAKIKNNDGAVTIELRPAAASGVSETFTFERTLES